MKRVLASLLFLSPCLFATTPATEWKSKIDELLPKDPDSLYSDSKLRVSAEQYSQARMYLIPKLDMFYSTVLNRVDSKFKSSSYGLSAAVNVFQFGKSYYAAESQKSSFEADKLENKVKKIQIENKYLLTLFKNTLLQKRLNLYRQIETLKSNGLRVAKQRFERGNLPRQQVDKVEIDLNNLASQRTTTERELLDSELEMTKFQLVDFKREWPFTGGLLRSRKAKAIDDFSDVKILNFKSEIYSNQLESSRRNYFPSLDLLGRAYENKQDDTRSHEWDVTLSVSWPLWDNYTRSINNLTAYREFQYWQAEKTRVIRDWDRKIQSKEEQFSKLVAQLNQSADNLKKLSALYQVTETLFSQGRITVNELFQDQQLLLETQINNENELFAFHQFLLEYCEFYTERVWTCF